MKIYLIEQKIDPNHQDEWYVYHHSDLSSTWYVSDCTVYLNLNSFYREHFSVCILSNCLLKNKNCLKLCRVFSYLTHIFLRILWSKMYCSQLIPGTSRSVLVSHRNELSSPVHHTFLKIFYSSHQILIIFAETVKRICNINSKRYGVKHISCQQLPIADLLTLFLGLSWSWSYGSWIYNYLCSQCL